MSLASGLAMLRVLAPIGVLLLLLAPAACGSSGGCGSTMPGAVYCHEEEGGGGAPKSPQQLAARDGTVFVSTGHVISRVAGIDSLETVADAGDREIFFTIASRPHEVCWSTGATIDCAAADGSTRRWLDTTADGRPVAVASIPGGSSFVAAYLPLVGPLALARVEEDGVVAAPFAKIDGSSSDVVVFEGSAYVVVGNGPSQIVRAPLDGSPASTVLDVPSYGSLVTFGDALFCVGTDGVAHVAPGPARVNPVVSRPLPVGLRDDLLARIDGDRVVAVDADGVELRTLWQRPAGFESELVVSATSDGANLYVALERNTCRAVGMGKPPAYACGDRGRTEIVRVGL